MNHFLLNLALAVIPVVLAITLHEAAHGYAALALGDTTAKDAGRLSLNPVRHIDTVGTILLPGFLLISQLLVPPHKIFFMFGWAKPVPVSAWKFRNPRQGMALVAVAGPLMNFFLAWVAALLMPTTGFPAPTMAIIQQFLVYFMLSNLVLGLFNLVPIPPLDGGRIAVGILPLALARVWARVERAGILIVLLAVFVLPRLIGVDPVGEALNHVLPWAFRTMFWLAGHDVSGWDGNTI
ncbi:MAG TPA: site-2 protease family protein [Rhodopila sp.]|uniref:site-2 protease family protein n=1 Tax=Rhodopila sp. TaxID=2480087 RepID=UPI002BF4C5CA|nr:site-2 protease family protein [Rhodopila sp.]HVY16693.1 site-2 protease family protein [Rhodopila sp.]